MAYRGEIDSLRARVKTLEAELERERENKARPKLIGPLWANAFTIEQDLEGDASDGAIERVIELLNETRGYPGAVSREGETTTWRHTGNKDPIEVALRRRDGKLRVRLRVALDTERRMMFRMSTFAVAIAALGAVLAAADITSPVVFAPAVFASFGASAWPLYSRHRRTARGRELFTRVIELLEGELSRPTSVRVRVEEEPAEEEEHEGKPRRTRKRK
jgi:hypothetical protein